eukprot:12531472-Alexandrium_andersonii.AAC.1
MLHQAAVIRFERSDAEFQRAVEQRDESCAWQVWSIAMFDTFLHVAEQWAGPQQHGSAAGPASLSRDLCC